MLILSFSFSREAFDELHDRALDDRQFGIKFAIVFSNKTIYSLEMNDGTRLQVALMRELQNTYMSTFTFFTIISLNI